MKTRVNLSGICRSISSDNVKDGYTSESINVRPDTGEWKPMGDKVLHATVNGTVHFMHVLNNNVTCILYNDSNGYKYDVKKGIVTTTKTLAITSTSTVKSVSALDNTLLLMLLDNDILTSYKLVYDFDNDEYREFADLPEVPLLKIMAQADQGMTDTHNTITPSFLNEELVTAGMNDMLSKLSAEAAINANKYYFGYGLVRLAFELTDGTLVKHSPVMDFRGSRITYNTSLVHENNTYQPSVVFNTYVKHYDLFIKTPEGYDANLLTSLANTYKGIISSLNVYVTIPKPLKKNDLRPISAEQNNNLDAANAITLRHLDRFMPVEQTADIKEDTSMFLATKIPLENISQLTSNYKIEAVFNELSSMPVLDVDELHHRLAANGTFEYNGRVFCFDTVTHLFEGYKPEFFLRVYEGATTSGGPAYNVGIEVDISTPVGTRTVFSGWSKDYSYYGSSPLSTTTAFLLFKTFTYPDARAKTMRIYYKRSNLIYLSATYAMVSVPQANFAACRTVLDLTACSFITSTTLTTTNSSYADSNRVQASGLSNIFTYPAINSQRVGNGTIKALSSNSVALSQGQFGMYGLYCFTSDGVWVMNIGNGTTLIDSIVPISGDVLASDVVQLDGAIAFFTDKHDVLIARGAAMSNISVEMDGDIPGEVNGQHDNRSTVPFSTYASGAKLSVARVNELNSEILLCNSSYNYSYIYSLNAKTWFKSSDVYDYFVKSYPARYGVKVNGTSNAIYSLDREEDADHKDIYIETRPIKLTNSITYKKIERVLVNCRVGSSNLDNVITVKLYGSVDGLHYNLVSSKTIHDNERILFGKLPYSLTHVIITINGVVCNNLRLTNFDFEYNERYNNKLRC